MTRKFGLVVVIGLAAWLLAGCGGIPLNAAATAFAPTDPAPPGTPILGTATLAITPEALLGNVIRRSGEEHRYSFTGEAGQAVTINMEAAAGGSLDSFLELYGPSGGMLASNDDGGSGVNSQIANYVLPESGEYTILAAGFNRASTGSYAINLIIGTPIPTPTPSPTPEPGGGPISTGEIRSGAINSAGQVDDWQFSASAGDFVTIRMETTGIAARLDPFIELVGPDGGTLYTDDDSGTGLDAQLQNVMLPAGGEYTIRASGLGGSTGIYNMVLRQGLPPTATLLPPTPGPSPTPFDQLILLNERVQGELRPNTGGDVYILQVDQPLVVELLLEVMEPEFNLYLEMTEPVSGTQQLVEYSSAAPVIYLPSLFMRMQGNYIFRIRAVESRFVGYTFQVNRVEASTTAGGEISYGQGLSGALMFSGQEDVWTFEGRAGDTVTIIMKGVGLDSYLQLLDANGAQLATNDDAPGTGSLDARIDRVRLPADGTYTIVASSFRSGGFGPYRLLLFREE
ncbi:MAG: PPC domain-containing protein [Anaerolineae bacterium]|nr:PPC domain-containing protein [Anaerolineae bacterium]